MSTVSAQGNLSPSDFQFLTSLIQNKSAIVLEASKGYLIESRLLPIVSELGLGSLTELVGRLRQPTAREDTQRVIEAMTTNETSFFRDLLPFQALQSQIIPELIAKRSKDRQLSIWSNACSSGQEVYSIAMLLLEHFPELKNWKIKLIASDLSSQILQKAKQGLFNQTEVNRGLPMPMLLKYFVREGTVWKIKDEVRNMVEFREINLIENWPAALNNIDVVFLRNVLIYFSPETKAEILAKVRNVVRDDGYLFLGGVETTMNLNVRFERQAIGKAAVYRPN
jgi:chemotaxis protein methyltransferase CheR